MRVLATGGSGLVGRHLLAPLSARHDVTVLDLRPAPAGAWKDVRADIRDPAAVSRAMTRQEAVVHLAAIPNPLADPAETVFTANAAGAFNTIEAAARAGVRRFVFISSDSVLGFTFPTRRPALLSVPVDETHPTRPQDAYGLSKLAGEMIAAAASERTGMETVCLRPPWIWVPEERALHRDLLARPESFAHSLWSYIEVDDLAAAVLAAIERPLPAPHQVLFAAAPDSGAREDVRGLVARFYPEAREAAAALGPFSPLLSSARLAAVLGTTPQRSWRDVPELAR